MRNLTKNYLDKNSGESLIYFALTLKALIFGDVHMNHDTFSRREEKIMDSIYLEYVLNNLKEGESKKISLIIIFKILAVYEEQFTNNFITQFLLNVVVNTSLQL